MKNSLIKKIFLFCLLTLNITISAEIDINESANNIQGMPKTEALKQFNQIQNYIIDKLNKKSKEYPKDTLLLIQKGWMSISLGNYRDAIKDFNKSIDLLPTSSAYIGLGMAYNNLGESDKADKAYRTALTINPERAVRTDSGVDIMPSFNADLYKTRVLSLHDESISELNNLIQQDSELTKAYSIMNEHKYDRALLEFEKYLKKHPESYACLCFIGSIYNLLGLYSKGEVYFLKALDIDKKQPYAYIGLGNIELEKKNYDKAILLFKEAESLNNKLLSAKNGIEKASNMKQSITDENSF